MHDVSSLQFSYHPFLPTQKLKHSLWRERKESLLLVTSPADSSTKAQIIRTQLSREDCDPDFGMYLLGAPYAVAKLRKTGEPMIEPETM
jgi:hypothetical protein